ncbi:hypothetical protein B0H11DRAFT_566297 [Mycena galericulata]|nr:hypothetical protein B0H11DRAFT_566297 [Mycena galericulata]
MPRLLDGGDVSGGSRGVYPRLLALAALRQRYPARHARQGSGSRYPSSSPRFMPRVGLRAATPSFILAAVHLETPTPSAYPRLPHSPQPPRASTPRALRDAIAACVAGWPTLRHNNADATAGPDVYHTTLPLARPPQIPPPQRCTTFLFHPRCEMHTPSPSSGRIRVHGAHVIAPALDPCVCMCSCAGSSQLPPLTAAHVSNVSNVGVFHESRCGYMRAAYARRPPGERKMIGIPAQGTERDAPVMSGGGGVISGRSCRSRGG